MINVLLRRLPHNSWNQRWGIGTTMTLTAADGVTVYLKRRRLIQTPWFAVYLHDILTPDVDQNPHSHPFPFVSVVLRGGYCETVWKPTESTKYLSEAEPYCHVRLTAHTFPRGGGQVHRIDYVLPRTKTLVFAGRRRDSWGFFVDGTGLVPWREYLGDDGTTRRVRNDD